MEQFIIQAPKDNITFEQKIIAIFGGNEVAHHKLLPENTVAALQDILAEELGIIPGIVKNNPLSIREMLCLILLATGKSPEQCATLLNITSNTLSSYLKRIHKKLQVRNRTQAFFISLQRGYLQISDKKK